MNFQKWGVFLKVLIYDGDCIFCSKYIYWLYRSDKKKRILFSTFDSKFYTNLKINSEVNPSIDSVIYYREKQVYYKSTAIIEILKDVFNFGFIFNFIYLCPLFIRDKFYDNIAKIRYKLIKSNDSCNIDFEFSKRLIK